MGNMRRNDRFRSGPTSFLESADDTARAVAATQTAHYLEYFPMVNAIVDEPLRVEAGICVPTTEPGNGLSWNERALNEYLVG